MRPSRCSLLRLLTLLQQQALHARVGEQQRVVQQRVHARSAQRIVDARRRAGGSGRGGRVRRPLRERRRAMADADTASGRPIAAAARRRPDRRLQGGRNHQRSVLEQRRRGRRSGHQGNAHQQRREQERERNREGEQERIGRGRCRAQPRTAPATSAEYLVWMSRGSGERKGVTSHSSAIAPYRSDELATTHHAPLQHQAHSRRVGDWVLVIAETNSSVQYTATVQHTQPLVEYNVQSDLSTMGRGQLCSITNVGSGVQRGCVRSTTTVY